MTKLFYRNSEAFELTLKKNPRTKGPNAFEIWKGDSYNSQRELIKKGLTKRDAVDFLKNY